jgi:hypothetical protein
MGREESRRVLIYWLGTPARLAFILGMTVLGFVAVYAGFGLYLRYGIGLSLMLFSALGYRTYRWLAGDGPHVNAILGFSKDKAAACFVLGLSTTLLTLTPIADLSLHPWHFEWVGAQRVPEGGDVVTAFAYAVFSYGAAAFNATNMVLYSLYRMNATHYQTATWPCWFRALYDREYRRRVTDELRAVWKAEEEDGR